MILCDIGNTSAHIWNNGRTNTINIEKFGNFKTPESTSLLKLPQPQTPKIVIP